MSNYQVPQSLLERLKKVSTATVWDQLWAMGYRKIFMEGVRSMTPGRRLAARARTLRFLPTRPDLVEEVYHGEESPNCRAMALWGPGDALVIDAMRMPYACIGGDVVFLQLKMNGADGLVTDGGIRDVPAMAKYGFPVYVGSPTPLAHSDLFYYDFDLPIQCGGALVRPGDVVMGDESGVVVIPAHLVEEVVPLAEESEESEVFIKQLVEKEGCTPMKYYGTGEGIRQFREAKEKGWKRS